MLLQEILRAASRSVPNEDYVQFMAAVQAIAELIEAAESALRREEFKQGPDAGNDSLVRRLRAALANVGGAA